MEQELIALAACVLGVLSGGWLVLRWWHRRPKRPVSHPGAERAPSIGESSLASALKRTRDRIRQVFHGGANREQVLRSLEEALLVADVGAVMTSRLVRSVAGRLSSQPTQAEVLHALAQELLPLLSTCRREKQTIRKPHVIVVVGVNGVGKTTSIAKLAWWYRRRGKRVLLIAADTFRAAAAEQLATWADRIGVDCVRHQAGADPAAVVFDGMKAAHSREADIVIIDTAGRMHSKQNLVLELVKIARTVERQLGGGSMEVLLVIDATMGQNATEQASVFSRALPVSGVCLTKLDGTAKGGIAVGIADALGLPVQFVGFGESLGDWDEFRPEEFVRALLGDGAIGSRAGTDPGKKARSQESEVSAA